MYLEIRTDDRATVMDFLRRQVESGRTARISLTRDDWVTILRVVDGDDEGAATVAAPLTRAT